MTEPAQGSVLGDSSLPAPAVESQPEQARAILSDHDAAPSTLTLDDGRVLEGWTVFTRELRLRDMRSQVRGTF